MRITPIMIFDQLTSSLGKTLDTYAGLNNELASGKKINAPSDDPYGILRALDYKVSINRNDQYSRNIDTATSQLNLTGTVLSQANSTLNNIVQMVTKHSHGQDAATEATDALQVTAFRDQMYDLANTKIQDQFLFSGFRSDVQSYAAGTYAYQGDSGVVNVPVGQTRSMGVNVPGTSAFSYTLPAATSIQLSTGEFVHYTPGAGTAVNVEIRASDDTTVLDTFSFSNVIQMTDLLATAISGSDILRVQALATPFDTVQKQMELTTTDVAMRLSSLSDQSDMLYNNTNSLQEAVSSLEDADQLSVIAQLKTTEVSLSALRDSASRVLSESLFDFLK